MQSKKGHQAELQGTSHAPESPGGLVKNADFWATTPRVHGSVVLEWDGFPEFAQLAGSLMRLMLLVLGQQLENYWSRLNSSE